MPAYRLLWSNLTRSQPEPLQQESMFRRQKKKKNKMGIYGELFMFLEQEKLSDICL